MIDAQFGTYEFPFLSMKQFASPLLHLILVIPFIFPAATVPSVLTYGGAGFFGVVFVLVGVVVVVLVAVGFVVVVVVVWELNCLCG